MSRIPYHRPILAAAALALILSGWSLYPESHSDSANTSVPNPHPQAVELADSPRFVGAARPSGEDVVASGWEKPDVDSQVEFHRWVGSYLASPLDVRAAMLPEGVALAKARRMTLARLIREDPEQALAAAVPMTVRSGLPAEITGLLEERVSGTGELALLGATPMLGKSVDQPLFRRALIGRQEYQAFTYGRLAKAATLAKVFIHGIAVDEVLAVSDSPKNLIGDEVLAADGAPGSSTVSGRPPYAWTHGEKKVLIIRVDFSDKSGTPVNNLDDEPITPSYAVNLFNGTDGIRDFYDQSSYGQTSLLISESTDVTGVLRMPGTAASYATGNLSTLLHSDARALAQSAGFAVDSYDRIGVVFTDFASIPGNKFGWAGLANIIGKNFWIQSQFTFGTVAHEIGHNFGLNHANRWNVIDGNPVSPTGTSEEYGDPFDVMGGGGDITAQFDVWKKSILQWLPDNSVKTVISSGTVRLHRFDDAAADLSKPLALKIVRNATQDYWIGYRRATDNPNLNNGVSIVWGGNQNDAGVLLDMTTPGDTPDDASLAMGATFTDAVAGITLHPVAQGGSGADEWMDVEINFQPRISWAKSDYDVDEGVGMASLTLKRDNNSSGSVSVHWATSDLTATAPADYTASSGDVTWADGDMADKVINIPVVADAVVDSSQKFLVTLSDLTGGVLPEGPVATVSLIEAGVNDPGFKVGFINSQVEKVLPLPDGSMLIGGPFTQLQGASGEVFYQRGGIGRVLANGVIDTTWGVGGGARTDPDADLNVGNINDLARQPDGKVLVAGNFTTMHGVARNRIARLNSDGSLDGSFDPGSGANGEVNAVLVQPNGKILIGGDFTTYNGVGREYVARLNPNGSLDTGFEGPDFAGNGGWRVNALALQANGRLLVAGAFYFSGSPAKGGLCRVTETGALDASFNGITSGTSDSGFIGDINTVVVQLDGKIVVGGAFTQFNGSPRGRVARLESNGSLDVNFFPTGNGEVRTLLIQNDGKIVLGGDFTTFNGAGAEFIVRLNPGGTTDSAFSAAGGFDDTVFSLGMQADGKILAAVFYAMFQGAPAKPLWRMFGGLPSLPGTIQLTAGGAAATEGQNAVLTVSRRDGSGGALSVNYATVAGSAGIADFTPASGVLTWADGDAADKTISIPITGDGLSEIDEAFTLNLGQALLGGAILGSTQTAEVIIHDAAVSPVAYAAWQADQFTEAELTDPAISGDLADPDHDGVGNLLEFAFGLLPKTPDALGLPDSSIVTVGADRFLALTFRRQINAPEISYRVESNSTLAAGWTADAVQVGPATPNGDGTETVVFRDILSLDGHSERFMRVRITLAP